MTQVRNDPRACALRDRQYRTPSVNLCKDLRHLQYSTQTFIQAKHSRDTRTRPRRSRLHGRQQVLATDGVNFRNVIDEHSHLSAAMANHDRERQHGPGHGQAQASSQIDEGNDRSPEIGHSGQQARHAGHDGDRFHLKHFTDVAEIDGEQLAPSVRTHIRSVPSIDAAEDLDGLEGP